MTSHVFDLPQLSGGPPLRRQSRIFATQDIQVTWFALPAGTAIPAHESQGEMILHCLHGVVNVETGDTSRELRSGQILCLSVREAVVIHGVEDAALLATVVLPKDGGNVEFIG